MTNTEPTPIFRRFPWVQLAFCIACLTMTVWTWMMFSYAWDVKQFVGEQYADGPRGWPHRAYACVVGEVDAIRRYNDLVYVDVLPTRGRLATVFLPLDLLNRYSRGDQISFKGRMVTVYRGKQGAVWNLDSRESRFHPASIAGLVVGAMGCFIFGLYLRAWLRERKALASKPQPEMIA